MPKLVVPPEEAHRLISESVTRQYPDAEDFRFSLIGGDFMDGNAYYVEFKTTELDDADSLYYAFVNKDGCKLLDDGEAVIEHIQNLLDRRRNILQRLSDFDFLDIVGALIAVLIMGAFVILVLTARAVSNEYLALVSLVLGYYFGRNRAR